MADGKGFRIIVKINLPPEKEYHSGHSIIVQGETPNEVRESLARIIELTSPVATASENALDQAQFILLRFAEYAQGDAVKAALGGTESGAVQDTGPSGGEGKDPAVLEPGSPGRGPAAPDLASTKVLEAIAKKTGKSLEELGELTKAQATEMLKGGK